MRQLLLRFHRSSRGAIMMVFALCLFPLLAFVGLSIDYAFYAQARAQFSLAGDGAASYAIRVASATYALDTQAGEAVGTATLNAEYAGDSAGTEWFATQIATLPRAYVAGGSPTVAVTPISNSTNPTGFIARVGYSGVYPPFYDLLFKSSANWYVTGTSVAQSSYTYSEILLLMDTSGSMLIASDPAYITELDDSTVCIPTSDFSWTSNLVLGDIGVPMGDSYMNQQYYNDDTQSYIPSWSNVTGFSGSNEYGSCKSGYNDVGTLNSPGTLPPCAFACHTTTTTATFAGTTAGANGYYQAAGTYTQDLYGLARSLRPAIELRLDAVFSAAETVIEAMQKSEQVANQYAIGVYQFNDNIAPIAPAASGGSTPPEATTDLTTALSEVEADDYTLTPTETAEPPLSDQTTGSVAGIGCSTTYPCENEDYTNFPLSMEEWSPNYTVNSPNTPVTKLSAAGTGSSSNSPLKTLIIVTDGLEDSTPGNNTIVNRLMGEMTGIAAEAADTYVSGGSANAMCQPLKDMGFNIYVLYITYYPIPSFTYYEPQNAATSTPYVAADFPTNQGGNLPHTYNVATGGAIENWVEGDNRQNDYESGNTATQNTQHNPVVETDPDPSSVSASNSPDAQALEACAGPAYQTPGASINVSKYFFSAENANSINNAMVSILQSALNTTIRITN